MNVTALCACILSVFGSALPCCCMGRLIVALVLKDSIKRTTGCPNCCSHRSTAPGVAIESGKNACHCKAQVTPNEAPVVTELVVNDGMSPPLAVIFRCSLSTILVGGIVKAHPPQPPDLPLFLTCQALLI